MLRKVDPFSEQEVLRLMRVSGEETRRMDRDAKNVIFAEAYIAARECFTEFDAKQGEGHYDGLLNAWFRGLVRNARKRYGRQSKAERTCARASSAAAVESLTSGDDPEATAAADQVLSRLSELDSAIVESLQHGASISQAAKAHGVGKKRVGKIKRRLSRLLTAGPPAPVRVTHYEDDAPMSWIDRAMEFAEGGAERARHLEQCRPCLLCSWWIGFTDADAHKSLDPAMIADADVAVAMRATRERKADIAEMVRERDDWQPHGAPSTERPLFWAWADPQEVAA